MPHPFVALPRYIPVFFLLVGAVGACVPRERPDDEQGKSPRKASRQAAVASLDQVQENQAQTPPDGTTSPSKKKKLKSRPSKAQQDSLTARKPKPPVAADPPLSKPFLDDFSRDELGDDWRATSERWRIDDGRLCVNDARNHPLWLRRRVPTNARIEFTATSYSSDGDIKVELWGDGRSAATGTSYNDATGYLAIFGGWKNQFHVLARLDEHATDRPEIELNARGSDLRARPVEQGVEYAFKIERADGKTLRWLVDDIELFNFQDKSPLVGEGHEYFGFNNWQVKVCFDNLKIVPLSPR